ncbi:hypothetical protein [Thalassospira australica]|uniref:hypothetical protein n=1 Tax=Thalassospira australica TaxID=1528106 RepID=UPI0012E078BD|nr:hypothetical protein [Thalassospira australica]
MKIEKLFQLSTAKSRSIDDYDHGDVPFVTNTELNNGVVAYVSPQFGDKVFTGPAICISGLGHATVHFGEFLPKGNGGDSCTILKTRQFKALPEIVYYAVLFNTTHKWRFSYGRKANIRRISGLQLPSNYEKHSLEFSETLSETNNFVLSMIKENQKIGTQQTTPSS